MDPLLDITDLTMDFGENRVLEHVSLTLHRGEVHGLLGHNGSGKSTLIKILAGVHAPVAGTLAVCGKNTPLPLSPDTARRAGLAFVHQGLGLADDLTVLDNLAVVDYKRGPLGSISWRKQRAAAQAELQRFGMQIPLDRNIGELEPVERAIVAISRALASVADAAGGRLLVLDEPTVYLPKPQIEALFSAVAEITAVGDSVLFVSHRIDEVLRYTDRVTVLRNGIDVAATETSELAEADVIRLIVGRELTRATDATSVAAGPPIVTVTGLTGQHLAGVDFVINRDEILGLTGLNGSGFAEAPYLLAGAQPGSGSVRLHGRQSAADTATGSSCEAITIASLSPSEAVGRGIALIPADRKSHGIVPEASVAENMTMPALSRFFRRGLLRIRQETAYARNLVADFNIRVPGVHAPIEQLSGGNQQKAVLAKWLSLQPALLVMDEPTQGVDVGGRIEIWDRLREASRHGTAVVVASESAEELAELCDRVVVFHEGRITDTLTGADLNKDTIVNAVLTAPEHTGAPPGTAYAASG